MIEKCLSTRSLIQTFLPALQNLICCMENPAKIKGLSQIGKT